MNLKKSLITGSIAVSSLLGSCTDDTKKQAVDVLNKDKTYFYVSMKNKLLSQIID